ncbi:dipeptidase [Flavitalea antarctica]
MNELSDFIAFSTISSSRNQQENMRACAVWLAKHLQSIGMQHAAVYKTMAHPVVFATYNVHPSFPTILFYGHYDVQPVDPLAKWDTQPFKAEVKGAHIYGRGSSDDKGQLFIHIKAVEHLLKKKGSLPVNVKFLIEGAEEIGSKGLKNFIIANQQILHCDAVMVSDTKMISKDIPAITYSLRGALNAEITIKTSGKDLHSGTFGGCVPNAAIVLSNFLSSLHYDNNSIAIEGFYDDVVQVGKKERMFMKMNGPSDEDILKDAAIPVSWGEANYTMYERTTIRPSLSVTGISGGYGGEGVKNVIPSSASAKLNFRLVRNQNPGRIEALLNRHIERFIPKDVWAYVKYSSQANPVDFKSTNSYLLGAASKAYESVFHVKPRLIKSGGTIPAVEYMSSILKAPVILMGFALASDNIHAPNERFYLPNFFRGVKTVIEFIKIIRCLDPPTFHPRESLS